MQAAFALSFSGAAAFNGAVSHVGSRSRGAVMETKEDLIALAKDLNPVIGYYDPLNLADANFWGQGDEATIGWLRESELKHGRIAMFGFVGFMVHSLGARWPEPIAQSVPKMGACETWDAIPEAAKLQIVLFVGLMEVWRENKFVLTNAGEKHYMKGGKPGFFPPFNDLPHPVPFNLFDPFGISKGASEEKKARGRVVEINNGRLAMIGLFGFISEAQVPGSVPALSGLISPYSGDVMQPFANNVFTNPSWF